MDPKSTTAYPHPLHRDPAVLARSRLWSEEVYQDLLRCRQDALGEAAFRGKYVQRVAILVLDITGFTQAAIRSGELHALLRILDVHQVCGPVFDRFGAILVRAFADDLTALFDRASSALDAALEIQRRVAQWNASPSALPDAPLCCIGVGYGDVFAIGPNRAMGDEMNRASKLGEDIADGGEILVTESVYREIRDRADCRFERRDRDDGLFPYYEVQARAAR